MNNISAFVPLFQTVIWAAVILVVFGVVYRVIRKALGDGNILEALNISIKGVGFAVQLRSVQEQQNRQQEQIDALRFLAIHFVTSYELTYLSQLAENRSGPPSSMYYREELYRLRSMGLITNKQGKQLATMREADDLKGFVQITAEGRKYLELLGSLGISERGISTVTSK